MPEVLMPRLTDSMEEGTIVAWLVEDGALVARGEEIVEIETDKATMAYPADEAGVLRIAATTGTTVPPGAPIARIEVDATTTVTVKAPTFAAGPDALTSAAPPTVEADPPVTTDPPAEESVGDAAKDAAAVPASPAAAGSAAREPSRIERLVAKRMVQSRTEIPDFSVTVDIDMSAALALRADLKLVGGGKRVPSVNDLIVKACALTLREHPRVNSAWIDDRIVTFDPVNVGVAVATDDGSLVVPVIADADRLTLGQLAERSRELTKRARIGRITPPELSGGTFTVSNLGMLGVAHFTAIITPGQGAILAVGSTVSRFVPVDGAPVARPVLTATLCSDHRVIYGAHAAAFLDRLRTLLEHPGSLAL